MLRMLYMLCLVLSIVSSGQSQSRLAQRAENRYKEAMDYYETGDIIGAYELMEPVIEDFPDNAKINALFGNVCFDIQRYHDGAVVYLEKAAKQMDSSSYLNYTTILMELNRLMEAEEFIRDNDLQVQSEFEVLLKQIINAKDQISSPVSAQINWLSSNVNTPYTEHTPLISRNDSTLYFTSRKPLDEDELMSYNGQYDEDIFISQRSSDGTWSIAQPIKGNVNDILNDATVSLNESQGELIVFRTTRNLKSSDLWVAKRKSNQHRRMDRKFPESINSRAEESGLTMNTNGDVFYISSNREGGLGGMDLYRVRRFANGEYSRAVNLGPEINSPYDEVSPYLLLDDKTLYFASNRPESMGGFDIFKATLNDVTGFGNVQNLGFPLNTTRDDLHLSISVKTGRAYFTRSSEKATADFDICEAILPGFNLKATVYRIKVVPIDSTIATQAEATLFAWDYSEVLGQYTIDANGRFVVVLLPDEEGILNIDCPGFQRVEQDVQYQPSEKLNEVELTVELKPVSN